MVCIDLISESGLLSTVVTLPYFDTCYGAISVVMLEPMFPVICSIFEIPLYAPQQSYGFGWSLILTNES